MVRAAQTGFGIVPFGWSVLQSLRTSAGEGAPFMPWQPCAAVQEAAA